MLHFAASIIMVSLLKGDAPEDDVHAVLLQQIGDTYDECLGIVVAVEEFDDDFTEDRRRTEGVAINAKSQLNACSAMVKMAVNFKRNYYTSSQLVLGGLFQSSERMFLKNHLKDAGIKLGETLYVATLDGAASNNFHALCDNKGATVVVVETTEGVIFGGYSDVSWSSSGDYQESSTSFLFQIRPSMKKFLAHWYPHGNAVFTRAGYGPTFGNGHDLHIASYATTNTKSYTSRATYKMSSTYELNNGEQYFQVKDYFVLQALPL